MTALDQGEGDEGASQGGLAKVRAQMQVVELDTALEDLRTELEASGAVPGVWREAFAPDGDLAPAWNACNDAMTLFQIHAALSGARPAIVFAAAALAKKIADSAGSSDPRVFSAIATAERWARGESNGEEVRDAMSDAWLASGRQGLDDERTMAGEAGAGAALYALAAVSSPMAVTGLVVALVALFPGYDRRIGAENRAAEASVAALVRTVLPCPSLP